MAKVHVKKGDSVYVLNGKDGGKKGKALAMKHDLMDEAQLRFAKQIAEVLAEPATTGNAGETPLSSAEPEARRS